MVVVCMGSLISFLFISQFIYYFFSYVDTWIKKFPSFVVGLSIYFHAVNILSQE